MASETSLELYWVSCNTDISFDNNLQAHDVLPECCTSWRLPHYYFNSRKTQKIKPVPFSAEKKTEGRLYLLCATLISSWFESSMLLNSRSS